MQLPREPNLTRRHWGCLFPAFLAGLAIWLLWPMKAGPKGVLSRPTREIAGVIERDYQCCGLVPPPTQRKFLSAVEGSSFRVLKDDVRVSAGAALGLAWLTNSHVSFADKGDEYLVRVRSDVVIADYLIFHSATPTSYEMTFKKLPAEKITKLVLDSATAGTRQWTSNIADGYRSVLIGSQQDAVPPMPFDLPMNGEQLRDYKQWLVRMVGPAERFQDGWGRRIRLAIDANAGVPLLAASSAGPDGKWGTSDDLILKRNTENGMIVEKIGFDRQK